MNRISKVCVRTTLLSKQAGNGAENKMVDVYYPYCPLGGVVLTGLFALQISVPCLLKLHILKKKNCSPKSILTVENTVRKSINSIIV